MSSSLQEKSIPPVWNCRREQLRLGCLLRHLALKQKQNYINQSWKIWFVWLGITFFEYYQSDVIGALLTCLHTKFTPKIWFFLKKGIQSHLPAGYLDIFTIWICFFPPFHNLRSCRRLWDALMFQLDLRCGPYQRQIIPRDSFHLNLLVQPKQAGGDKRGQLDLSLGQKRLGLSTQGCFSLLLSHAKGSSSGLDSITHVHTHCYILLGTACWSNCENNRSVHVMWRESQLVTQFWGWMLKLLMTHYTHRQTWCSVLEPEATT